MKNRQYKLDIIPGIALALVDLIYLLNIPGIATFTGLGATPLTNHFVPYLWGGCLMALSLWLVLRGILKYRRFKASGEEILVEKKSFLTALKEKREVVASFAALAIYVALMEPVGFVIMTVVYVFAQILILTPTEKWKKNIVPALITGVVCGGLLYYVFAHWLNVLLPAGILSF